MKKALCIFLILLTLFGIVRLYYFVTDDFRLSNITYALPFKPLWEAPPLERDEHRILAKIFDQPFSYIGKGAQSYAFASEDGKYVLKFFKFKHLKPSFLVEILPDVAPFIGYKQNCVERKARKLIGVFNGYDLAFRKNRESAHLIYLHLVPTDHLQLKAIVRDKIGFERSISLDDVVFIVQRKGETLRTRLCYLLGNGEIKQAKNDLELILAMYISEYERGIYDHDHGVLQNSGFIGEEPFHLDLGKLNQDDRMKQLFYYKQDFAQVIWKMDAWIQANYPQYHVEISSFLAEQYFSRTGELIENQSKDPKIFTKKRKWLGL